MHNSKNVKNIFTSGKSEEKSVIEVFSATASGDL
jgi:hypothetical protein